MTKLRRNGWLLFFAIVGGCYLADIAWSQGAYGVDRGQSIWAENFQQAQKIAAQQRRFILLHFWNDNCPPCVRVEQNVFRVPEVERAMGVNYVPVRVHVGENPQLVQHFNVTRWPTDVIVTPDGKEVYKTVSHQDPLQYITMLDRVATHARVGMTPPRDAIEPIQTNEQGSGRNALSNDPLHAGNQGAANPYPNNPQPTDYYDRQLHPRAPNDQLANYPPQPNYPPVGTLTQPIGDRGYAPVGQNGYSPQLNDRRPDQNAVGRDAGFNPNNPGPISPPNVPIENRFVNNAGAPNTNLSVNNPPPAPAPSAPASPKANPTVALDGFCPVTLLDQRRWQKADVRFGAVHRDRTYLFAGADEQQRFLANPDKYSPMLSGFDPVRYVEQGQLVEGKRQHGVTYGNQMYLFADETALQRFWSQPQQYTRPVLEAMRMSVAPTLHR